MICVWVLNVILMFCVIFFVDVYVNLVIKEMEKFVWVSKFSRLEIKKEDNL